MRATKPNREQRHLRDVRQHRGWYSSLLNFFAGMNTTVVRLTAMITLAATIWSYLYLWFGDSQTAAHFSDATGNVIKLHVTNKGPKLKSSYLRTVDMHFIGLPIDDVQLEIANNADDATRMVIPSGTEGVIVPLNVSRLRAQCRQPIVEGLPDRYTKKEILSQIDDAQAVVTLHVQESDDNDVTRHTVRQAIRGAAIRAFIERYLPDRLPEKTSC